MTNKLTFSILLITIMIGGFLQFNPAIVSAQTTTTSTFSFPEGCGSGLGYSATTGDPCSGTNTATTNMPGCTTALGYSATTGDPCSGGPAALNYLTGCTSTTGYSAISGEPCNGTDTATLAVGTTSNPGLPTTGAGGDALVNIMLLLASAGVVSIGATYIARDSKKASQ